MNNIPCYNSDINTFNQFPSNKRVKAASPTTYPTENLLKFEQLDSYWQSFFREVDTAVQENFWGNLSILRKSEDYKDPYISQLKEMGLSLVENQERPISFYEAIAWVMGKIEGFLHDGVLTKEEVILPAKAFITKGKQGIVTHHFIPLGKSIPENAETLNLLTPDVFVRMLAEGYFPISEAEREHTNQTLAEHDLAHMAGFISNPRFMKAVRKAFGNVQKKMQENPRLAESLKHFDSLYSLRLYYMIEIFTEVPEKKKEELQILIELPLDMPISLAKERVREFLHKKAKDPIELNKYLAKLYAKFHQLVNPLGGESRDMLNRRRKFHRGNTLGTFYDKVSKYSSKFDHNSIYALFLNAKAALENKRSNHNDYNQAIDEIHTPFIGALIGTSQLEIEDWVLEAVNEKPDPESKLYRYLHDSKFWENNDILLLCYTHPDYDFVLNSDNQMEQMALKLNTLEPK